MRQGTAPLPWQRYRSDSTFLRRAIDTWKGARKHFTVKLSPGQIRNAITAKLRSLPSAERAYWNGVLAAQKEPGDSLIFLALSLDPSGNLFPWSIPTRLTELFLDPDLAPDLVSQEIQPVLRPYPVGLFVPGLGPLVANDAYASPAIWDRFQKDQYHSPRVVWGREVNLLFLGLAYQLERTGDPRAARRTAAHSIGGECVGDAAQRTLELPDQRRETAAGALWYQLRCAAVEYHEPGGSVHTLKSALMTV